MATKKLTYVEQLKHPNWQKKRLETLEDARWECEECGGKEITLHVHHKQYFKGRMAWEYSRDELAVLCESCHEDAHHVDERIKALLASVNAYEAHSLLAGFFGGRDGVDQGFVEEARQVDGYTFSIGFTAGIVAFLDIDNIEKVATYAAGLTHERQPARKLLADGGYVFGRE